MNQIFFLNLETHEKLVPHKLGSAEQKRRELDYNNLGCSII